MVVNKDKQYKWQATQFYNQRVKERQFRAVDLVPKKPERARHGTKKLYSNCEGPFKVTKVAWLRACQLEDLDGKALPYTWNSDNLRNNIDKAIETSRK